MNDTALIIWIVALVILAVGVTALWRIAWLLCKLRAKKAVENSTTSDKITAPLNTSKKNLFIIYALIAVLFGWLSYASYCNLTFNPDSSAGLIVSALGILVAALVGWQVFNAIENTKTLRRMESLRKDLTEYREQARQDAVDNYLHSIALTQLGVARDHTNGLNIRYTAGLNVVRNLMTGLTPTNYIPMISALDILDGILVELRQTDDEAWRYMFLKFQHEYERQYDDIMSAMETNAQHLSHLKVRIKRIRDERIDILRPYQGKTWDVDYVDYVRQKKAKEAEEASRKAAEANKDNNNNGDNKQATTK